MINQSKREKESRKRFIAGAICPSCQRQDQLRMFRQGKYEVVECVACNHQQYMVIGRESNIGSDSQHRQQIIGLFRPE